MTDGRLYLCRTTHGIDYLSDNQIYEEVQRISMQILRKHYWGYKEHHEDLMQEVAMEVFNAMHRYNPDRGEINGFIFGVASREISTQVKKIIKQQSREVAMTDEMIAAIPATTTDYSEYEDYIGEFEKLLNKTERKVLEMRLSGMNNTQIYNKLHRTKRKRIGKAMQSIWRSIENKYHKFKGETEA